MYFITIKNGKKIFENLQVESGKIFIHISKLKHNHLLRGILVSLLSKAVGTSLKVVSHLNASSPSGIGSYPLLS